MKTIADTINQQLISISFLFVRYNRKEPGFGLRFLIVLQEAFSFNMLQTNLIELSVLERLITICRGGGHPSFKLGLVLVSCIAFQPADAPHVPVNLTLLS